MRVVDNEEWEGCGMFKNEFAAGDERGLHLIALRAILQEISLNSKHLHSTGHKSLWANI